MTEEKLKTLYDEMVKTQFELERLKNEAELILFTAWDVLRYLHETNKEVMKRLEYMEKKREELNKELERKKNLIFKASREATIMVYIDNEDFQKLKNGGEITFQYHSVKVKLIRGW